MTLLSRRTWWTGIAALAVITTLGCDEADAPLEGTYIARIGETLIAVVVDDPNGLAVAYACDGRDGVDEPLAVWFDGTLADGAAELTGPDGSLSLTLADGVASGELRLTGAAPQAFDGPRSTADGVLLWASTLPTETDLLGGWIFADDGTQRGAVLKRSIGDTTSIALMTSRTTSLDFEGEDLTIKTLTTPLVVD